MDGMMKCLKFNIFSFLILVICQLITPCFLRSDVIYRTYSAVLAEGYDVKIKFEGRNYWILDGEYNWVLLKGDAIESGAADDVLFLDANSDGVKDIFVKLFESGASNAYALFITQIKGGTAFYLEYNEIFGSPYLNSRDELVSIKRDGPFAKIEIYKVDNGYFFLHEVREPINSDLEKVRVFDRRGGETLS